MVHAALTALTTDEFAVRFGVITNPRALHRALERSEEVKQIRSELWTGTLTEESMGRFASQLLRDFRPGDLFIHDVALASLAVVLEPRPTSFANEFIHDLARLSVVEMPMAIRVAREADHRRLQLPGNKLRVVMLQSTLPGEWKLVSLPPRRVDVGTTQRSVELEPV